MSRVLAGEERSEVGLRHEAGRDLMCSRSEMPGSRIPSGKMTGLHQTTRAVAIHHKPGYDPCELFLDPELKFPKLRIARRILQKKLGFRMTLDVVPLDASIVRQPRPGRRSARWAVVRGRWREAGGSASDDGYSRSRAGGVGSRIRRAEAAEAAR